MSRRKVLIGIIVVVTLALIGFVVWYGVNFYKEEKLKNATVIVELIDDLSLEFDSDIKLSDLIKNINGELIKDEKIDTTKLGEKEISFKYINDEDIEVPYSFKINIIDTVAPLVWLNSDYYINTNFNSTLEEKILCADNYDDEPVCKVLGDYDTQKVGNYNLEFVATDSSGNETNIPFILHVTKPSTSSSNNNNPSRYKFEDAVTKYKSENASVGIDVSFWQGDIDFEKVKEAGVEFAFIRIGSRSTKTNEIFMDSKFERNIEGFKNIGIPVGVYFYSYAKNEKEAREDAEWIVDNLKGVKLELPIAFDFEDWSRYNSYKMSLYRLNKNADVFIETVEKSGYDGMLYGSLNYLNKMWKTDDKTIWVAHYTNKTNYEGIHKYWQFSMSGQVDGINGAVDLDIMYK